MKLQNKNEIIRKLNKLKRKPTNRLIFDNIFRYIDDMMLKMLYDI